MTQPEWAIPEWVAAACASRPDFDPDFLTGVLAGLRQTPAVQDRPGVVLLALARIVASEDGTVQGLRAQFRDPLKLGGERPAAPELRATVLAELRTQAAAATERHRSGTPAGETGDGAA